MSPRMRIVLSCLAPTLFALMSCQGDAAFESDVGPRSKTIIATQTRPSIAQLDARESAEPSSAATREPAPGTPLSVEAAGTSAAVLQGGLLDLQLRPADLELPFFGLPTLLHGGRGLWLSTISGTTRVVGVGLVDALAPAGPLDLWLRFRDSATGHSVLYLLPGRAPNVPQVTARVATPLVLGTMLRGEALPQPKASNLYRVSIPADRQALVLRLATEGSLLPFALAGATAPASGRFADGSLLYASQTPGSPMAGTGTQTALAFVASRGDLFASVFAGNLGGAADARYSVLAQVSMVRSSLMASEGSTPDSPSAPLATLAVDGAVMLESTLEKRGDVDHIHLPLSRDTRLFVRVTVPGQGLGPPVGAGISVRLAQGDCTTTLAPARPVQQEAVGTMAAGTCAILSSPTGYVGPYQLLAVPDQP